MIKFSEVKKLPRRRSMSLNGVKFVVLKQLFFYHRCDLFIQIETFENTRLFLVIFNF